MKKKINLIILAFLFVLSLVVVIIGMGTKRSSYEQLRNEVFNIIYNKDVSYNEIYKQFVFYRPTGFEQHDLDSQVELVNNDADVFIHFGTGKKVDDQFYTNLNQNLTQKYEYIDEDNRYFLIWKYDDKHSLVMIGQNDRFVEGLVDEHKEDEYLLLLSQVYASINELEE